MTDPNNPASGGFFGWKLALIEGDDGQWRDLSDGWFEAPDRSRSRKKQP